MNRTAFSAQFLGDSRHVNERARVFGIHLGRFRMEDERCASALAQFRIGLEIAGIAREVFVGGKLRGIQKHAHHNTVVFGDCALDQALVALMQIAHRGHQANRKAFLFPLANLRLHVFHGISDFHRSSFFKVRVHQHSLQSIDSRQPAFLRAPRHFFSKASRARHL